MIKKRKTQIKNSSTDILKFWISSTPVCCMCNTSAMLLHIQVGNMYLP